MICFVRKKTYEFFASTQFVPYIVHFSFFKLNLSNFNKVYREL